MCVEYIFIFNFYIWLTFTYFMTSHNIIFCGWTFKKYVYLVIAIYYWIITAQITFRHWFFGEEVWVSHQLNSECNHASILRNHSGHQRQCCKSNPTWLSDSKSCAIFLVPDTLLFYLTKITHIYIYHFLDYCSMNTYTTIIIIWILVDLLKNILRISLYSSCGWVTIT